MILTNVHELINKFKTGHIIKEEESYCYQHRITYNKELHILPTGREMWIGTCSKCKAKEIYHVQISYNKQISKDEIKNTKKKAW